MMVTLPVIGSLKFCWFLLLAGWNNVSRHRRENNLVESGPVRRRRLLDDSGALTGRILIRNKGHCCNSWYEWQWMKHLNEKTKFERKLFCHGNCTINDLWTLPGSGWVLSWSSVSVWLWSWSLLACFFRLWLSVPPVYWCDLGAWSPEPSGGVRCQDPPPPRTAGGPGVGPERCCYYHHQLLPHWCLNSLQPKKATWD